LSDKLSVDENISYVHVPKQAAVPVGLRDILDKGDSLAHHELGVVVGGFRSAWLSCLRSIDADVTNPEDLTAYLNIDGVPVYDSHNVGLFSKARR